MKLPGVCVCLFMLVSQPVWAKNGFDLSRSAIPVSQIHHGGPPRDGIPAIDAPRFIDASEVDFIENSDRILGLYLNGEARAYPIAIMNWHEIVNDDFGGAAVAVTFCPLCGTGMAFSAELPEKKLDFGVSGLLYQSDVLLYDRQTESLWSQLLMRAVSGPMQGTRLELLSMSHTTWQDWLKRYPNTRVLSTNTGYSRDYSRNPYLGYASSPAIYFDVNHQAPKRYHAKEQVLGVVLNGQARAYPFSELSRTGKSALTDAWQGKRFTVQWNELSRSAFLQDEQGGEVPATVAFWFAWYTFYPDGSVFTADP